LLHFGTFHIILFTNGKVWKLAQSGDTGSASNCLEIHFHVLKNFEEKVGAFFKRKVYFSPSTQLELGMKFFAAEIEPNLILKNVVQVQMMARQFQLADMKNVQCQNAKVPKCQSAKMPKCKMPKCKMPKCKMPKCKMPKCRKS
jgi:hypothetical protein